MKTLIVAVAMLVGSCYLQAEDVYPTLKIGTKEFVNVRVLSVNPSGLKVIHDAGGGLIKFADLPADLQKKYGYDSVKADAHDEALKAEQQQAMAAIEKEKEAARAKESASSAPQATRYPVSLKVVQVLKEGCLCNYKLVYRTNDTAQYSLGRVISGSQSKLAVTKTADEMIFVSGIPGLLADGAKAVGFISVVGTYSYEGVSGAARTVYRCEFSSTQ